MFEVKCDALIHVHETCSFFSLTTLLFTYHFLEETFEISSQLFLNNKMHYFYYDQFVVQ